MNIHINKLIRSNKLNTITKFIANYIKERISNTTYNITQRYFKFSVSKINVCGSSTYTPKSYTHTTYILTYAYEITIITKHNNTWTVKAYIQPYIHKITILNPDKTILPLITHIFYSLKKKHPDTRNNLHSKTTYTSHKSKYTKSHTLTHQRKYETHTHFHIHYKDEHREDKQINTAPSAHQMHHYLKIKGAL